MQEKLFKATQISVFLENRAGMLAEVIHILADAGINLRAISLADTSDFGILRIMVSEPEKAEEILKARAFTTGRTSVLGVEMPDEPGALDFLLNLLSSAGINVEYMYAYARRALSGAVMIFRFDKIDEAITLLLNNDVRLIPATELLNF